MAVNMHYADLGLFTFDINGNRIDKSNGVASINALKSSHIDHLVIPNDDVPNSSGYPTLSQYLKAEAIDGFKLYHLDQTKVITYDS